MQGQLPSAAAYALVILTWLLQRLLGRNLCLQLIQALVIYHFMCAGRAAYSAGMLGYCQVAFLCTAADSTHRQQQQHSKQLIQQPEKDAPAVLLWGCDFVPWPTPDLALSTMFTYVQGCSFDAAAAAYISARTQLQQKQQQQQQCGVVAACNADVQRCTPARGAASTDVVSTSEPLAQRSISYACLHAPGSVLSPDQMSALASICIGTGTSANAKFSADKLGGGFQNHAGAAGAYEVLVSLDACTALNGGSTADHDGCAGPRTPDHLCGKATGNAVAAAAVAVSGLLVCCTEGGVVRALSCLSEVVGSLE
jgi:hypothetical protein